MNSSGATFAAEGLVVRRCVFQNNGQLGFGANRAHDLLFSECVVRNNNVKGFSRGWEAGGDKLVYCRGAVLEKSQFVSNRGNGVWFDIGNEKCVVRNCLIADNEDAGIFYEISYSLHAHDNVIVGNGFNETPGAWGAASAISLSSSPDCVIERNLMVGNREGFNFREQNRKTPLIDDKNERWIWNHDQLIRNNVMALNRDAQVWGWFDVNDGRHWPAVLQDAVEKQKGKAAQDLAADYLAKDTAGATGGIDPGDAGDHLREQPLRRATLARTLPLGRRMETAQEVREAGRRPIGAETRERKPDRGLQGRGLPGARLPCAGRQSGTEDGLLPERRRARRETGDLDRSLNGAASGIPMNILELGS